MDDECFAAIAESGITVEEAGKALAEAAAMFKDLKYWWEAILDSDLPLTES